MVMIFQSIEYLNIFPLLSLKKPMVEKIIDQDAEYMIKRQALHAGAQFKAHLTESDKSLKAGEGAKRNLSPQ